MKFIITMCSLLTFWFFASNSFASIATSIPKKFKYTQNEEKSIKTLTSYKEIDNRQTEMTYSLQATDKQNIKNNLKEMNEDQKQKISDFLRELQEKNVLSVYASTVTTQYISENEKTKPDFNLRFNFETPFLSNSSFFLLNAYYKHSQNKDNENYNDTKIEDIEFKDFYTIDLQLKYNFKNLHVGKENQMPFIRTGWGFEIGTDIKYRNKFLFVLGIDNITNIGENSFLFCEFGTEFDELYKAEGTPKMWRAIMTLGWASRTTVEQTEIITTGNSISKKKSQSQIGATYFYLILNPPIVFSPDTLNIKFVASQEVNLI